MTGDGRRGSVGVFGWGDGLEQDRNIRRTVAGYFGSGCFFALRRRHHKKMKKISTYIWENKIPYLLAVVSLLIAVTLDMMAPRLTKSVVDDVIVCGNM